VEIISAIAIRNADLNLKDGSLGAMTLKELSIFLCV
jgi:hypothetical protein